MPHFDEDKQNRKISDLLRKEEEDSMQALSNATGIPYVDLSIVSVNTDALRFIEESVARQNNIAAFALVDKVLKVAIHSPESAGVEEVLNNLRSNGFTISPFLASTASLQKAWASYKDLSFATETKAGSLEVNSEDMSNIIKDVKSLNGIVDILNTTLSQKKGYRVSRILETILAGSLALKASDVHIEPEEKYVRLRYRLDGVLTDVINFDHDTYNLLLSRIKLLSGLKLNIKHEPQDGRFSIKLANTEIEIRTSMLPGAYSESIVMRVLNPSSIATPLEDLGISPKLLGHLLTAINKPNGMILNTGPTGSGKTTTLYALLKKIHDPSVDIGMKIITIEDPIEYHLEGITQTQVNDKGYNFLEGLRSALRQDPDVIMVGEIRDSETARIAIDSALTGHLVFSTLHTNTAAGTFPRLIELGINPKVITSAITLAMAQRLVRKLCDSCKKQIPLEAGSEIKKKIDAVIDGIVDPADMPPQREVMYLPVGCKDCNQSGYKGRVGVYEAILMSGKDGAGNREVENAIESMGSEHEIAKAAKVQAIPTMAEEGVVKVLKGITSLEELERVIEL